jgi:hypothetical protein
LGYMVGILALAITVDEPGQAAPVKGLA